MKAGFLNNYGNFLNFICIIQVADEKAIAVDKRAQEIEQESKDKDDQLEELYNQIDGMQEYITSLETERDER